MCHIVFEKAQDRAGKVSRTSVYAKQPSESFFKKVFIGNFAEFIKKTFVPESLL